MEEMDAAGKRMLSQALKIAKAAVLMDTENELEPALHAYEHACKLLLTVIQGDDCIGNDKLKLQRIHDTYAERAALLRQMNPASHSWRPATPIADDRRRSNSTVTTTISAPPLSAPSSKGSIKQVDGAESNTTPPMLHAQPSPTIPLVRTTYVESPTPSPLLDLRRPSGASIQGMIQTPRSIERQAFRPLMTRTTTEPVPASTTTGSVAMQKTTSATSDTSPKRKLQDRLQNGGFVFGQRSRRPSQQDVEDSLRTPVQSSVLPKSLDVDEADSSVPASTTDQLLQPYMLFSQLRQTLAYAGAEKIAVQLTPALQVSGDIWRQKDCKIKAEEEKIQAYDGVARSLRSLCLVEEAGQPIVMAALGQLEAALITARAILAKKLGDRFEGCLSYRQYEGGKAPTRKMSSASKGLTKLLTRRTSSSSGFPIPSSYYNSYSIFGEPKTDTHGVSVLAGDDQFEGRHRLYQAVLSQIFDMSQVLARLNESMDPDQMQVKDLLRFEQLMRHAADFFGNVVIRLYLHDIGSLLTHKLSQRMAI
ncbi:hypothetical protein BCR37DRAFT_111150 [Protomyces lactucae-debilis]|uniref:MIT domain-containing protein n=1 Tax=Protomyces lactucae-debilis TaxID=2754530 RepID=A0A1Y2F454_PROLT|nr:uncharacterized protein BCR37DRAFT_111150 [Protomyces lactucae-debilis]ORY78680.1 hypothetical protein BCR37DRAFT_111150 [Protomyces lactucae-debilis]